MPDLHAHLRLPFTVCVLSAACAAQGWADADATPPGLVSIAYDSAHQRAVGMSAMPPATWSFDGTQWRRHMPDGIEGQIPTLQAYDPVRTQSVLVIDGQRPYVSSGIGWASLPLAAGFPWWGAAAAFDGTTNKVVAFDGQQMLAWNGTAWIAMNPTVLPSPRSNAGMAFDPVRGRLVLFGGGTAGVGELADTWEWNGAQWSLQSPAVSPSARAGKLVFDPAAQEVVLLGGETGVGTASVTYLTDCWGWNGTTWTLRGALPAVQARHQGTGFRLATPVGYHDGSNLFVVTGDDRADVYRRSGTGWVAVWTDPQPAQHLGGMAYDPTRNEVLLAGGRPGTDTWAWNGTWQLRSATGPGTRTFGAMASLGAAMVLFGGLQVQQVVGDTWTWNGTTWSQPLLSAQPSPRAGHAMASDGNDVLLFGGWTPSALLADTWRFDGVQWAQLQPLSVPPARNVHGLAHDPIRQRTVLFGGLGQSGLLDDTWEWDGANWNWGGTHPSPDQGPLAFDSAMGRVVNVARGRVWSWNGSQWLPGPAAWTDDIGGGLAFDTSRQRLVAYSQRGTTWVYGATPAAAAWSPQSCGSRPDLRMLGRPMVGSMSFVHVEAAPNTLAIVAYGLQPTLVNWAPGCDQRIAIDATLAAVVDAHGRLPLPFPVPATLGFRGVQILAQAVVLDGGPVLGASLSGTLRITIGD